MNEGLITVFITKYALSKGIITAEASIVKPSMIEIKEGNFPSFYHGKEWHITEKEAKKEAEKMRIRRYTSLKNQLKKLENLKF